MNEKEKLRFKMKKIRENISNRKKKSTIIVQKIIKNDYYRKSKIIGLYMPLLNEVDIHDLINYSLTNEKIVLLPKVYQNNLFFIQIDKNTVYEKSSFGVIEPIMDMNKIYNDIDLLIIPGLAFSKDLSRLGYGKGYYDRFLEIHHSYKIGVCFEEQFLAKIPSNQKDIKMDLVISA